MLSYLRSLLSAADDAAALQRIAERTNPDGLRAELVKALGLTVTPSATHAPVVEDEVAEVLAA